MPDAFDPAPFTTEVGRIVSGQDVENAAIAVLKKWSSTYLACLERQNELDVGSLPRIRSWTTTPQFDKWPEDQLPAVLIISPGLIAAPIPEGQGFYRASFSLAIAVVVSAATLPDTARLAKLYVAALRSCLIQHQSLEGFADGIDWLDENYDDLPLPDRSLGAGKAIFGVEVHKLSRRWNGPSIVPTDPTDPIPPDVTIETVEVTAQAQPIEEEL